MAMKIQNPKHRNPKQLAMLQIQMTETTGLLVFCLEHS